MSESPSIDGLHCPVPLPGGDTIKLAHGGGGELMHRLIRDAILPRFPNQASAPGLDAAVLDWPAGRLAFTTDSYVVRPLFFPGGDIGALAVNGTVNDLAMSGARPIALSVGFILEEGLPLETLHRVVASMGRAAEAADVQLVTGDTKVVDKGKGDGLYINTAGVGRIEHDLSIGPSAIRPGDVILLSGDVGRHGIAIMAVREGLEFESVIESDCAPLAAPVLDLLAAGIELRALRDLTRGGLATALVELAEDSGHGMQISRAAVPVREDVQGACEMLGLDPLYVANEGRFVAILPEPQAQRALDLLQSNEVTTGTRIIGHVKECLGGRVVLQSEIGTLRRIDRLSGEQLPRIC